MNELLREIQEDIRQERVQALLRRYGKAAIQASIAVIIGTALGVGWQHWRASVHEEQTLQLVKGIELLNAGKYEDAIQTFEKLDAGTAHGHMAALNIAQAHASQGNKEAEQKAYETLAKNAGKDAFADLGALLAAKETDSPITVSRDSAFYFSQAELRGWQLLNAGKKAEAVEIFSGLSNDNDAPESLRHRVRVAVDYLSAK